MVELFVAVRRRCNAREPNPVKAGVHTFIQRTLDAISRDIRYAIREAYSVAQRTREMAIRVALGAPPRVLAVRVVTQTLSLAVIGLTIGVPSSWIAARAIQGLLFNVSFSDPLAFGSALTLLMAVAGLGSFLPAQQASRVDPIAALKAE